MQAWHGASLLHLTFRSEQRMQAKEGFNGVVLSEDAEGFMLNNELC